MRLHHGISVCAAVGFTQLAVLQVEAADAKHLPTKEIAIQIAMDSPQTRASQISRRLTIGDQNPNAMREYIDELRNVIKRQLGDDDLKIPEVSDWIKRDSVLYFNFTKDKVNSRVNYRLYFRDGQSAIIGIAVVRDGIVTYKSLLNLANQKTIAEFALHTDGSTNVKLFHWNGTLESQGNYLGDKCIDLQRRIFFENGQIAVSEALKDGINHGPKLKYKQDGVVIERSNYSNGKLDGYFSAVMLKEVVTKTSSSLSVNFQPITITGYYKLGNKVGKWTTAQGGHVIGVEQFDNNGQMLGKSSK